MKKKLLFLCLSLVSFLALSQTNERLRQPNLEGDLLLDFGMNLLYDEPDSLPVKPFGSTSIGIYYNRRFAINDYLSFVPAVGFTFEKYRIDNNYTWVTDYRGVITPDTVSNLSKNKLAVSYLEVPVEFRIHPFGTVDGEGFFIGLGAMAGVKIGSHTKTVFRVGDQKIKEKVYHTFGLNDYRYGVQGRLGFRAFHLFYKMYFNDLFRRSPDPSGNVGKSVTFGINFSGF